MMPNLTSLARDQRARVLGAAMLLAVGLLVSVALMRPSVGQTATAVSTWTSQQFGLSLTFPTTWRVTEEVSDPTRGDVVILSNDVWSLAVAFLHDTRSPRQMAADLISSQRSVSPDLKVLGSTEMASGAVVVLMQYTVGAGTSREVVVDEKALLGALRAGEATITIRGTVPDNADVEAQFYALEDIVRTMGGFPSFGELGESRPAA